MAPNNLSGAHGKRPWRMGGGAVKGPAGASCFAKKRRTSHGASCRCEQEQTESWWSSVCQEEMLGRSKQLVSWRSNFWLSGGIDLLAAGFNIRCISFWEQNRARAFFFICAEDSQDQRAVYNKSFKFPPQPGGVFPQTNFILMLTVSLKAQARSTVTVSFMKILNVLNFPLEEKSGLEPSDDPGCGMKGEMLPGKPNYTQQLPIFDSTWWQFILVHRLAWGWRKAGLLQVLVHDLLSQASSCGSSVLLSSIVKQHLRSCSFETFTRKHPQNI